MNDLTTLVALGGAGGLVASCWGYIKSGLTRLTGLAVVRVTVEYGMTQPVETLIWKEFKQTRSSFPTYNGSYWFVQPHDKYQRVGFEMVGNKALLFWRGWRPMIVQYSKEDHDLTLTFLRGTFIPDEFMSEALARYNREVDDDEAGRFQVIKFQGKGRANGANSVSVGGDKKKKPDDDEDFPGNKRNKEEVQTNVRLLGWSRDQLGQPKEGRKAIERMALTPDVEQAIQEARNWVKSGKWYRERNIAWRRGWLLHGLPGCGKSTLSVAVAQDLAVPLYVFDLGSMSNKELTGFWKEATSNTPAVILIEDVDAVFHGRENVVGESGGGLSFDALLNTISGVENSDGIFLIITTNNLQHIDPALGIPQDGSDISTRPGRIDRALQLSSPNTLGRMKIAKRILAHLATPELLDELVNAGANDTGAQFQERVGTYALKLHCDIPKQ